MLARYQIVRGARRPGDLLPQGVRHDTRKHTRHVLRPTQPLVLALLQDSSAEAFARFERDYVDLLKQRFATERHRFDELAELARDNDLYLGCNCPTQRQPDIHHCHTVLALAFLRDRYPDLDVRFP